MSASDNPVRRCSQCDVDWPNIKRYNLCPKCRRCTWASTTAESVDYQAATKLADTHDAFHKHYDAREKERLEEFASFEAAFAATPSIPDPPANAQDVRYPHVRDDMDGA